MQGERTRLSGDRGALRAGLAALALLAALLLASSAHAAVCRSPLSNQLDLENYVCRVRRGEIAVLTTYFVKHQPDCRTNEMNASDMAVFRRRVNEAARALANFPFLMFAEFDSVGTAGCLPRAGLAERIAATKYEIDTFSKLPHGVIYLEAGESDATQPALAAKMLNAEGINKVRGFFVGDTHQAWTSDEIAFASGVKLLDAFAWVTTPGRSGGHCHPGDAPSGAFDVNRALGLASRENERLGPAYPSRPY